MYIEAGGWPTNDHMFGVVEFQRKKKNVGGGEFFWLMLDSFYEKKIQMVYVTIKERMQV